MNELESLFPAVNKTDMNWSFKQQNLLFRRNDTFTKASAQMN